MDVDSLKRIILRLFPELTAKAHLPKWGKVVDLPELPEEGDKSDRFYPHYAADIQLLDEQGNTLKDTPPLQAVPLPVSGIGEFAGVLAPPAIGSIVEIGWMFGQADKPFIRTVLPLGWRLPAIKAGEYRYQQRKGVYKHVDQSGNFYDVTDKLAKLQCELREVKAKASQDYRSPKSWFGSESENLLKLVSDLMQVVSDLSSACSSHTHKSPETGAPTSLPEQSADIKGPGTQASKLKARLDPITK